MVAEWGAEVTWGIEAVDGRVLVLMGLLRNALAKHIFSHTAMAAIDATDDRVMVMLNGLIWGR